MTGRWPLALGTAVVLGMVSLSVPASGVFVVTRKGVPVYEEAKNGFIQGAYAQQLKGFSPQAVELDGSDKDAAALEALKAKAPDLVFCIGAFAAKKTRSVLPDVPVVYAMSYYPEAEGLTADAKMVGVQSLGAPKLMAQLLKGAGKIRSVVLLHHISVAASAATLTEGLNAEGLSVSSAVAQDAGSLKAVLQGLAGGAQAVLLVPDPLTLDAESCRFIISQCIQQGQIPVSYTDGLVANGAAFAAFFPPGATGSKGAEVAAQILSGGIPSQRLVSPNGTDAATALNKSTAQSLRVKVTKEMGGGTVYE